MQTAAVAEDEHQLALAEIELARIQTWNNNRAEAVRLLASANARGEMLGSDDLSAYISSTQAWFALQSGAQAEAEQHAAQALQWATKLQDVTLTVRALRLQAEAALMANDLERVTELLTRAQKMLGTNAEGLEVARLMTVSWKLYLAQGQLAKAKSTYESTLKLLNALGNKQEASILETGQALA